jgi:hypothetical protein
VAGDDSGDDEEEEARGQASTCTVLFSPARSSPPGSAVLVA